MKAWLVAFCEVQSWVKLPDGSPSIGPGQWEGLTLTSKLAGSRGRIMEPNHLQTSLLRMDGQSPGLSPPFLSLPPWIPLVALHIGKCNLCMPCFHWLSSRRVPESCGRSKGVGDERLHSVKRWCLPRLAFLAMRLPSQPSLRLQVRWWSSELLRSQLSLDTFLRSTLCFPCAGNLFIQMSMQSFEWIPTFSLKWYSPDTGLSSHLLRKDHSFSTANFLMTGGNEKTNADHCSSLPLYNTSAEDT